MDNYEKLRESKIIYEYINDLLENGNFEMHDEYRDALNTTMSVMADIYTNTHILMQDNKEERLLLNTDLNCPHCSSNVIISDLIPYAYVCERCDENYYLCEGDLNYEWYFNDKYKIKLKNNSKEDTSMYNKYYSKIYKVSPEKLHEYVENWTNKKEQNYNFDLLYCEKNGIYIAVDNRSGECYVEEFETEAQAVFWLSSDVPVEEIKFNVISTDIIEKVDKTNESKINEIIL